jgi:hypothetical protein
LGFTQLADHQEFEFHERFNTDDRLDHFVAVKSNAIQAKVYEWFEHRYPDGPRWTSSSFDCFRDAPLELRMLVMMDKVEGEIANGGLPQLLWNVFFHWQHVLADSEAGYEIIGAISQRDAIREFRSLFERYEQECRSYIDRCISEQEFDYFNKWCDYGYTVMSSESERLFYTDSGVYEQRLDWMTRNQERLVQAMAT